MPCKLKYRYHGGMLDLGHQLTNFGVVGAMYSRVPLGPDLTTTKSENITYELGSLYMNRMI